MENNAFEKNKKPLAEKINDPYLLEDVREKTTDLSSLMDKINDLDSEKSELSFELREFKNKGKSILGRVMRGIYFEMFKKKIYLEKKDKYIKKHHELFDSKKKKEDKKRELSDLTMTKNEENNFTQEEYFDLYWPAESNKEFIKQGSNGNCYFISVLNSFKANFDFAKDILKDLISEQESGVYKIDFPGEKNPVIITDTDILQYKTFNRIGESNNLGDTILEVAYNELLQNSSDGFKFGFRDDADYQSKEKTNFEHLIESGKLKSKGGRSSLEVFETFIGNKTGAEFQYYLRNIKKKLENIPNNAFAIIDSLDENMYFSSLKNKIKGAGNLSEQDKKDLEDNEAISNLGYYIVRDINNNRQAIKTHHAFSIIKIDKENKYASISNPNYPNKEMIFSFDQMEEYFMGITIASIS